MIITKMLYTSFLLFKIAQSNSNFPINRTIRHIHKSRTVKTSLEDNSIEHGTQALDDVCGHQDVDLILQVALGVLFADVLDG